MKDELLYLLGVFVQRGGSFRNIIGESGELSVSFSMPGRDAIKITPHQQDHPEVVGLAVGEALMQLLPGESNARGSAVERKSKTR